jgi:hypothetical protein
MAQLCAALRQGYRDRIGRVPADRRQDVASRSLEA